MPKFFSKNWSKRDFDRIRELISMASESEAAEVEIEADGVRVLVRKYASSAIQAAPPAQVVMAESMPVTDVVQRDNQSPVASEPSPEPPVAKGSPVLSPTPGTFYAKPAPDADPFVKVGDRIQRGQTVCIVEAMKLMNEVEAEVDGTVLEILVSDGDAVEYDQPLLIVDPA
ncbi:MAG: acetyl-CoA carboxylase biotin carboxyl carrier protein [Bacteroidetes bacterium]|nr:acetyl-CoA carboxylase biotin carboxyl carrier protein [Bacteroidota bacterium]